MNAWQRTVDLEKESYVWTDLSMGKCEDTNEVYEQMESYDSQWMGYGWSHAYYCLKDTENIKFQGSYQSTVAADLQYIQVQLSVRDEVFEDDELKAKLERLGYLSVYQIPYTIRYKPDNFDGDIV